MWATLKGHEETMIMLLDKGAAIDIQDKVLLPFVSHPSNILIAIISLV